jgi:hypothetical protein
MYHSVGEEMIKREHFSKIQKNAKRYPSLIGRFDDWRRGYHNVDELIEKPFRGRVSIIDTSTQERIGTFDFRELRKKYI